MSNLIISPGPVTTITLNRPEVRNALNEELIAELTAWASTVTPGGSIRVAVLRGAGFVFCAGADLRYMARMSGYTRDENLADAQRVAALFLALDTLPIPLIGRVHGPALGGGAGLAAVCDVVIATNEATFGFTETKLGIVPATISPYLVRKIGLSAARELCLSGERFSAARACDIGLVHEVVSDSELDDAVTRRAAEFLTASPSAIAATKRLLSQVHGQRPADVIPLTTETLADQRVSPEGQEGMRAFLDKRKPKW